jgi:hypothetical protein
MVNPQWRRVLRLLLLGCLALVWSRQAVAQDITVLYYRGTCIPGGAPCNFNADCVAPDTCAITASPLDDVTVVGWAAVTPPPVDLYQGTIGAGLSKGTFDPGFAAGPAYFVNVTACFLPDEFGADTGPLSQVVDPNPALGTARFYVYSQDGGPLGLPNVNDYGCSGAGLCNNPGWCDSGTMAGNPCNGPVDCPSGTCVIRPTSCSTAAGPGDLGGCALHSVCSGGPTPGKLCFVTGDCTPGSCPGVGATTFTPGQVCFDASGVPAGADCPPVGAANFMTRMIPPAVDAACP